ncbi:MAG TPA: GAF domain-containing protein, partial [Solirubrobacteraceae bacterium]|nr:GAF domain-containing protein [Solirubrobacteraceae bacterium]
MSAEHERMESVTDGEELRALAAEQSALRRVATLVAQGVPPEGVFAAVAREVGQLLCVDYAHVGRYEPGRAVIFLAAFGRTDAVLPADTRLNLGGKNVSTLVFESRRPARVESYLDASGPAALAARERRVRSSVGAPIMVEGSLWGVMVVGSSREPSLPADTEARLGSFTDLVATAIANAESRADLARLAEEQAALRRVANMVARGVAPGELFGAVTEAAGRLLGADLAAMVRHEIDDTLTVLATWAAVGQHPPVATRVPLEAGDLASRVLGQGRPVRMDGNDGLPSRQAVTREQLGIHSSVASPIVVEGEAWGGLVVHSKQTEPLPGDTESRLENFTDLMATAVANAESRGALAASRARIVAAADESRRRIERDLHDGAQQRLVHAVIVLKLALRAVSNGSPDVGELVAEALGHAEQANSELRELAHGILPAALIRGGLRAGVNGLVSRASLPVSIDVSDERLPPAVEATAYFVISEALTNAVKHARAGGARVVARVERGELRVEVRDDGVGGARGGESTGLGGLQDRVAALDGRLVVDSPPG